MKKIAHVAYNPETVPDNAQYVETVREVLALYRDNRIACLGCGNTEHLSDNGGKTLQSLSFCCSCGEQFEAEAVYL